MSGSGKRITPTPGNLVVRVNDQEQVTKSGLVLLAPGDAARATRGVVYAVPDEESYRLGDGDVEVEGGSRFRPGDNVLFGQYSGIKVKIGRGQGAVSLLIIKESNILAILDKEEEDEAPEVAPRGA